MIDPIGDITFGIAEDQDVAGYYIAVRPQNGIRVWDTKEDATESLLALHRSTQPRTLLMMADRCQDCTWIEATTLGPRHPEYIQETYCHAHTPERVRVMAEAWAEVEAAEVQP